jgi:urease accessory protein UreF
MKDRERLLQIREIGRALNLQRTVEVGELERLRQRETENDETLRTREAELQQTVAAWEAQVLRARFDPGLTERFAASLTSADTACLAARATLMEARESTRQQGRRLAEADSRIEALRDVHDQLVRKLRRRDEETRLTQQEERLSHARVRS